MTRWPYILDASHYKGLKDNKPCVRAVFPFEFTLMVFSWQLKPKMYTEQEDRGEHKILQRDCIVYCVYHLHTVRFGNRFENCTMDKAFCGPRLLTEEDIPGSSLSG